MESEDSLDDFLLCLATTIDQEEGELEHAILEFMEDHQVDLWFDRIFPDEPVARESESESQMEDVVSSTMAAARESVTTKV